MNLKDIYWTHLAEKYLKDPHNADKPLRIYPTQKQVVHFFQFGILPGGKPEDITEAAIVIARRGSGKTTSSCVAATMAACEMKNISVGLFATNEQRAKDMLNLIKYFIETSPKYKYLKPTRGKLEWSSSKIVLNNLSSITVYTTSHSIRGPHHEYGIIDEAAQMDDEIILADILPKFSVIGKRWVMLSTPYGSGNVFYNFLHMYELSVLRGEKPFFTKIVLDSIEDGRQSAERLEMYKRISNIGQVAWGSQEYDAEFISSGANVFVEQWVENAMTKYIDPYPNSFNNVRPNTKYCIGIDFGGGNSRTSIAVGHKDGDLKYLDYMETFEPPPERKFIASRDRLYAIMRHFPTYLLVPDCTGMGEPNVEDIQQYIAKNKLGIKILSNKRNRVGIYFDRQMKANLIESLQEAFESASLVLPYHYNAIYTGDEGWEMKELKKELLMFRSKKSGNYTIYGVQSEFDDRVIALSLLNYGLDQYFPTKIVVVLK